MSAYEAIYKIMSTMPVHTGEITAEMRGMITATKTKNIQTILAYPLKVGGTYMRVALIHLLSFHYQAHLSRGSYVAVGPNREPYFPLIFNQHVLTDTTPRAAVMHLHTVATQATTEIVEAFDIPVLIATRNIYDTLVSWANHQEKNLVTGGYPDWDFLTENGKPFSEMTAEERRKPEIIKATRKRRIAAGAGVQVQEVNRLLNQFEEIQKMMKMFSKGGMSKMMRAMQGRFPGMR